MRNNTIKSAIIEKRRARVSGVPLFTPLSFSLSFLPSPHAEATQRPRSLAWKIMMRLRYSDAFVFSNKMKT